MASDTIEVDLSGDGFDADDELEQALQLIRDQLESHSVDALSAMGDIVRDNVIDLTPRNKGDLQSAIVHNIVQGYDGDDYAEVFVNTNQVPAVVGLVMESGGIWSKMPPHKPIKDWAMSKIGLSDKEAERMAWALQHRIRTYGIPIPLTHDRRGAMFSRTAEKMKSTSFHFWAFTAEMRRRIEMETLII